MVKLRDCVEEVIVIVHKNYGEDHISLKTSTELKKEIKMIKEYCRKKKYYIHEIKIIEWYSLSGLAQMIFKDNFDKYFDCIGKVLVSDFRDIVNNDAQIFTLSTMLEEERITLESINEGMVGKDIIYKLERKDVVR